MAYIIPTFFFTIGENANCIVEKINPSEILSGEITLDDFYGKYAIDDTSNLTKDVISLFSKFFSEKLLNAAHSNGIELQERQVVILIDLSEKDWVRKTKDLINTLLNDTLKKTLSPISAEIGSGYIQIVFLNASEEVIDLNLNKLISTSSSEIFEVLSVSYDSKKIKNWLITRQIEEMITLHDIDKWKFHVQKLLLYFICRQKLFNNVATCDQNNKPVIYTIGHSKLFFPRDNFKKIFTHFATAKILEQIYFQTPVLISESVITSKTNALFDGNLSSWNNIVKQLEIDKGNKAEMILPESEGVSYLDFHKKRNTDALKGNATEIDQFSKDFFNETNSLSKKHLNIVFRNFDTSCLESTKNKLIESKRRIIELTEEIYKDNDLVFFGKNRPEFGLFEKLKATYDIIQVGGSKLVKEGTLGSQSDIYCISNIEKTINEELEVKSSGKSKSDRRKNREIEYSDLKNELEKIREQVSINDIELKSNEDKNIEDDIKDNVQLPSNLTNNCIDRQIKERMEARSSLLNEKRFSFKKKWPDRSSFNLSNYPLMTIYFGMLPIIYFIISLVTFYILNSLLSFDIQESIYSSIILLLFGFLISYSLYYFNIIKPYNLNGLAAKDLVNRKHKLYDEYIFKYQLYFDKLFHDITLEYALIWCDSFKNWIIDQSELSDEFYNSIKNYIKESKDKFDNSELNVTGYDVSIVEKENIKKFYSIKDKDLDKCFYETYNFYDIFRDLMSQRDKLYRTEISFDSSSISFDNVDPDEIVKPMPLHKDYPYESLIDKETKKISLFKKSPEQDHEVFIEDVIQGSVGDCYFLASLAAISCCKPDAIKKMVTNANNAGFSLQYYDENKQVKFISVNDKFWIDGRNTIYARIVPENEEIEIWPLVIEKAWAKANGGYPGIEGSNNPTLDYSLFLTGTKATFLSISSEITEQIKLTKEINKHFNNEKNPIALYSIQADRLTDETSKDLIPSHAYALKNYNNETGKFDIYNPHGKDHLYDKDADFVLKNFDTLVFFDFENPERQFDLLLVNGFNINDLMGKYVSDYIDKHYLNEISNINLSDLISNGKRLGIDIENNNMENIFDKVVKNTFVLFPYVQINKKHIGIFGNHNRFKNPLEKVYGSAVNFIESCSNNDGNDCIEHDNNDVLGLVIIKEVTFD